MLFTNMHLILFYITCVLTIEDKKQTKDMIYLKMGEILFVSFPENYLSKVSLLRSVFYKFRSTILKISSKIRHENSRQKH